MVCMYIYVCVGGCVWGWVGGQPVYYVSQATLLNSTELANDECLVRLENDVTGSVRKWWSGVCKLSEYVKK